jgi:hypothetical protein
MFSWLKGKRNHLVNANSKLIEAFKDQHGVKYYTWADIAEIPPNRWQKIQTFASFHDARISQKTIGQICTAIREINMKLAVEVDKDRRNKLHAQIGALSMELEDRGNTISDEHTFFEMAAILSVRQDEDQRIFNQVIQTEKAKTFKEASDTGHTFFLQIPILKKLIPALIGTEDVWSDHLLNWAYEVQRRERRLRTISSFG